MFSKRRFRPWGNAAGGRAGPKCAAEDYGRQWAAILEAYSPGDVKSAGQG